MSNTEQTSPMDEFNNIVPIAANPCELVMWNAERWRRQAIAHYVRLVQTDVTTPDPSITDAEITNMIAASRFCLDMAVHRQNESDRNAQSSVKAQDESQSAQA